jgi:ribosomal protein L13E
MNATDNVIGRAMDFREFENVFDCRLDRGLTVEEYDEAKKLGFLHVTGLTCRQPGQLGIMVDEKDKETRIVCQNIAWTGKWAQNNGKVAFWTEGGCVWVAVSNQANCAFAEKISKRGQGCFVPLSNGESLHPHHIMERMADPLWIPPRR